MAICPNCKKEVEKPEKTWKYGVFTVNAYTCPNCKTRFREYLNKNGRLSFKLKLQRGRDFIKA